MFKHMTVAARLYGMVGFMIVLMMLIGVLGLKSAKDSNDDLDTVYKDRVVPLKQLKVAADMYAVNIVDTSHKVRNGTLTWDQGRANVGAAVTTIDETWKAYLATELVDEETRLIEEMAPLKRTADTAVARLARLMAQEDREGLTKFTIAEMYPAIDPVSAKFSDLIDVQLTVAKAVYGHSEDEYILSRNISFIVLATGAFIAILTAIALIRNLTAQLGGERPSSPISRRGSPAEILASVLPQE